MRVFVAAQDFEDQRAPYPGLDVNPPVANLQSASDPVLYVGVAADISPLPFVVSSVQYPVVLYAADGDITDDDAKMNVALDEPGDVYYVVVPREYTYHELYTDGSRRRPHAGGGQGGDGSRRVRRGGLRNRLGHHRGHRRGDSDHRRRALLGDGVRRVPRRAG